MTIKVSISKSFKNQQIIIKNKFYLFGYKRYKRQLHLFLYIQKISVIFPTIDSPV